ncbi:Fatty acid oxidation complex subunit alpha [Sinobacterium norvegicum]|uniref:Fatty acid oxidation complex subunit alpha n=1 Tax=Sinobacterium norvegicum TaxID=1641715 RepID=A0ABM9AIU3_9GAMM|nr:3-hydroxyacyl-CoA dehydrogenase NAD-binding domain-containing protein [Sinobacterium norvegicum]CAH0993076.1 Fatty acid oxidation complex subunit alpha [Sinobacterium norvegicum]
MTYVTLEKDADNIVTLTLDDSSRSVNVMNPAYIEGMEQAVNQLEEDVDNIAGVIVKSGKKTFFAGGDLDEILALEPHQAAEYGRTGMRIKASLRTLETLGKPVVVAINGAALGGGFEICLACHHRIALDDRSVQIGLPEVTLGLLPGAGGVVRTVRLLGLQAALPVLSNGRNFTPQAALKAGLIDDIADSPEAMIDKARQWIKQNPESCQSWDVKGFTFPGGNVDSRAVEAFIPFAGATLLAQKKGLYPAQSAILNTAIESMRVDIESASRIESRYLGYLAVSPESKNLITYFFQTQKIRAGASRPEGFERSKVTKLGVIGAGMMGAGIAYSAATAGIAVVLSDVSADKAQQGKAYSESVLDKLIAKGRSTEEAKQTTLSLIQATDQMADLADCDLVIEAVFENKALKHQVTTEAQQQLNSTTIFASNTSTLPISELATHSVSPAHYIGLHFFSPVDKMPLVEIICGEQTSDETLAKAYDFVKQLRKTPIVVNDSRGFYTSRVYEIYQDEAGWLLEDGVKPALIENLAQQAGMPVGPLAANDEVAQQLLLDIKKATKLALEEAGKSYDTNRAPYQWLERMVNEHGRSGRAHGGGYYDYPQGENKRLWPELSNIQPQQTQDISYQDIQDRLLYCQSLEAIRCLEEGVLRSVEDCNIGSILGLGFPRYTGGHLQFVNSVGVRKFAERAQDLANRFGDRFTPPALLLQMAEAGTQF